MSISLYYLVVLSILIITKENIMNLLHLFDATEAKLSAVAKEIHHGNGSLDKLKALKVEKEYLLDILALLFKELER